MTTGGSAEKAFLTATELGDRIGFKGYGVNRVLSDLGWLDDPFRYGAKQNRNGTLTWPLYILSSSAFNDAVNEFLVGPDAGAVLKTGDSRRPPERRSPETEEEEEEQEEDQDQEEEEVEAVLHQQQLSDRGLAPAAIEKLEVITQPETLLRLVRLIDEAAKVVCLVSPYTGLHRLRNITRSIRAASKRGVAVTLVVREPDTSTRHTQEAAAAIQELVSSGLKLYSLRDLHAKIYISERHAILTSLNLWEASFNNSIEVGMWVPRAREEYSQVRGFFNRELEPHIRPTTPQALLAMARAQGLQSR